MTDDRYSIVCGKLHPNGQITIPKLKREELELEDGDIVYFEVLKVIAPDGKIRFEKKEKEEINGSRSKTE